ncbi:MAG: MoaD/ThiS family protein [Gemmatimonadota bacterium]
MSDTIRVQTLFFGIYGELAGDRDGTAELPAGGTVSDLIDVLRRSLDWIPERVVVAVNQSYAEAATLLRDGDEVALIPPVAGG